MKFNVIHEAPKKADATIVICFDKENLPNLIKSLELQISNTTVSKHLNTHGQSITTLDDRLGTIVFVNLDPEMTACDPATTVKKCMSKYRDRLGSHVAVIMDDYASPVAKKVYASLVNVLFLTWNQLGKYKCKPSDVKTVQEIDVIAQGDENWIHEVSAIEKAICLSQLTMIDLINTPSNIKTPEYIARLAVQEGKANGFSVKVFDQKDITKNKMEALLAVNKGSSQEARFLILEYKSSKKNDVKTLGMVGKGVTFDTGGISIKPSSNMHYMKSDMSGAAITLAFTSLCARLKLPINIVATIPLTENMVDGSATKPGDVIGSYLGKSIEIIDTDAEGRVILADGLGYITKNYKTDVLLDFATLTGSIIQTLGYQVAGLFSNNDELANQLYQSGMNSGEKCWRLPIWNHYQDDLKSDVADVKNFSGKPVAGAITAALFLKEFTNDHPAWAHLDIAGVSFTDNEYGSMRNATGYGLRILYDFVNNYVK